VPNALVLFGKQVRELRIEHGLSQEKLAEMCAVHRNFIGRVERGETNITFDRIMKIAGGLRIKPHLLFQLIPKQNPPHAETHKSEKDL
jgi:XRE family transcriptional regulator, regulator of sulfur utilization